MLEYRCILFVDAMIPLIFSQSLCLVLLLQTLGIVGEKGKVTKSLKKAHITDHGSATEISAVRIKRLIFKAKGNRFLINDSK